MTARIARLTDRALIRVAGPEAHAFLHRLLTQDVETLAPGELRYAALLTPQGRLLYDLFLFGEPDGVRIDVAAEARDTLLTKLKLHRLRAEVEISDDPAPVHALWSADAAPDGWRRDPRWPEAGFRYAGEPSPAALAETSDAQAYRSHRLALGLPDAIADGLSDKAYATEADLDLLSGVDFHKGCFLGQETTSRMKRRGGIRSRVLPLIFEVEAPAVGAEVLAGELRAGEIVAAEGSRALALLRLDRSEGELSSEGRKAWLAPPPWLHAARNEAPAEPVAG